MKTILKTLIVSPSPKKWNEYLKVKTFFKEREKFYDEAILFIEEFNNQHDLFPDWKTFQNELSSSGEDKFLSYVAAIINDPVINTKNSDLEFISYLKIAQTSFLEIDVVKALGETQSSLSIIEGKSIESIIEQINTTITNFHVIRNRVDFEQGTASLVYGEEASKLVAEIYENIKRQKHDQESVYYDLGVKDFEKVRIKKGDFVVIGGFTSQGKSVWARYLTYRLLVEYGLNSVFFTFEMSHNICLTFFHLLHANNKEIFPGTPKLKQDAFKEGNLTEEEEDFLFNVAIPDFVNNKEYGTLYMDQPNKSRYTMADLQAKLRTIENSIMPVSVVAIDYITLLYPLISGRGKAESSDVNQMIKEFKNTALTHTDRFGNPSPFVAISPAQVSRRGFDEAMKRDGLYDISAISSFTEFDTSGDVVLTTLLTPEMRAANQIRLQNIKNRDGELVIDPVDLHIALGEGFTIESLTARSEDEVIEALQTLNI